MNRLSVLICTLSVLLFLFSCEEGEKDPGPFVVDGWILQCETHCDQLNDCSYNQLLFDHGDLDNCKRSCEERLTDDDNLLFIDETPEDCLQSLYDQLKCIVNLGCDDYQLWKSQDGEDYPCMSKIEDAYIDCDGVETDDFLSDCGMPEPLADW